MTTEQLQKALQAYGEKMARKHQDDVDEEFGSASLELEFDAFTKGFNQAIELMLPLVEEHLKIIKQEFGAQGYYEEEDWKGLSDGSTKDEAIEELKKTVSKLVVDLQNLDYTKTVKTDCFGREIK